MSKIQVDKEELEKLGLFGKAIYQITYDFPSKRKHKSKTENKIITDFRNKLLYTLKYKINAYMYLESCWIITEEKLDMTVNYIEQLKNECRTKLSFLNMDIDKRIRIFPIFTTEEGYNSYEDQKIEFLMQFISESSEKAEKALTNKRIIPQTFWKIKKEMEIISILSEPLKYHKRYNELQDELLILDDLIHRIDDMRRKQKELAKRNNQ